jgi:hypothetical protein
VCVRVVVFEDVKETVKDWKLRTSVVEPNTGGRRTGRHRVPRSIHHRRLLSTSLNRCRKTGEFVDVTVLSHPKDGTERARLSGDTWWDVFLGAFLEFKKFGVYYETIKRELNRRFSRVHLFKKRIKIIYILNASIPRLMATPPVSVFVLLYITHTVSQLNHRDDANGTEREGMYVYCHVWKQVRSDIYHRSWLLMTWFQGSTVVLMTLS